MLRVLHVMGRLAANGTERQLAGMLRRAGGRHWEPTLAVLRPGDPLAEELREAGLRVYQFDSATAYAPRRLPWLRRLVEDADVVHASLWGASAVSRMVAATTRRPAVVVSERRVEDFRSVPARSLDRALRRLTDLYIANSAEVAEFIRRAHGVSRDRITVIRNGLDREVFHAVPAPGTVDRSPARVGMVGRLVAEKGHDVMLAALPAVLAEHPVELHVVGDGPRRADLESAAAGLPVRFQGFLRDQRVVADFLRGLDLFVMPSRTEGLPNALLEAVACGVPVVATDCPGMDAATGGVVPLVAPDDPAALARAVLDALDRPVVPPLEVQSFDDVALQHLDVFERAHARRARLARR